MYFLFLVINTSTWCQEIHKIQDFFFRVLSVEPELQPFIFGMFLSMYLITLFGNLLIILAFSLDSHLHTPMCFFISSLSFVDICFTTTTILKMLINIQIQSRVISYGGCITQMYFYMLFAALDDFLLTVMAYDRFLAICHPCTTQSSWTPGSVGCWCWRAGSLVPCFSLLESLVVLQLSFCTDLEVPHFFCEIKTGCTTCLLWHVS